jgi:hypothetical protein
MHRSPRQADPEDVVNNPQVRYNIGKTENFPIHVPTFLQKNDGDPAIKVNSTLLYMSPYIDDITAELFSKIEGTFASSHPRGTSTRSCIPPGAPSGDCL